MSGILLLTSCKKYILDNNIYDGVERQEKLVFVHMLTNNAK